MKIIPPPPMIPTPGACPLELDSGPVVAGAWIIIRAFSNWRVWNSDTGEYHRGCDGSVRRYESAQAAQNRTNKLNGDPA